MEKKCVMWRCLVCGVGRFVGRIVGVVCGSDMWEDFLFLLRECRAKIWRGEVVGMLSVRGGRERAIDIISVRGRVCGCCRGVKPCVGGSGCGSVSAGMHWYINFLPVCLRLCARLC